MVSQGNIVLEIYILVGHKLSIFVLIFAHETLLQTSNLISVDLEIIDSP